MRVWFLKHYNTISIIYIKRTPKTGQRSPERMSSNRENSGTIYEHREHCSRRAREWMVHLQKKVHPSKQKQKVSTAGTAPETFDRLTQRLNCLGHYIFVTEEWSEVDVCWRFIVSIIWLTHLCWWCELVALFSRSCHWALNKFWRNDSLLDSLDFELWV